jgi:hypothetical protein
MSGIVGSKFNIRGSGLIGSLGTDGQHMLSAGAGKTNVFETVAAASSNLVQIKQTVNTATETLSSTTATTISDFSVAITPAATANKILVSVNAMFGTSGGVTYNVQLFRDTTQIAMGDAASNRPRVTFANLDSYTRVQHQMAAFYLDNPSSTSELTYSCKWFSESGTALYMNRTAADVDATTYDGR